MDLPQSPGHDSADEIEDDQWHSTEDLEQGSKPAGSVADSPLEPGQTAKTPAAMRKRRRVTRACDECRRKKIKCDGKQPCTHCTVYSYECTYDQPSNRKRNPAPQYIEALESRLQKAEAILRAVLPDIDLDNPKFDAHGPQQILANAHRDTKPVPASLNVPAKTNGTGEPGDDNYLESMVEGTGLLDIDDQGYWDYHGQSSGITFIRRMRAHFDATLPDPRPFSKPRPMSVVLDSPKSASESPQDMDLPHTHDLPPKEVALEICRNALDEACALMRFIHRPTFFIMLDRIYDTSPEHFGNAENKYLPLLYAVLAVGCLFAKTENSLLDVNGYEGAIDQGFLYFRASRQLIDITDCRDLTSLQTVYFMVMFLQSSARLSTCYSYIGVALRAALRLGLHRFIPNKLNPIEQETRKRMFWVIRKMDIYVSTMLGLPLMLSDDDIDQEFPREIDDEHIKADEILSQPEGRLSILTSTNAHTRLVQILQKVMKYVYPIKGLEHAARSSSERAYVVSHSKIREIERDLQAWMEDLPMALRPSDDAPKSLARVQQLLRMSYAHVQMMLYRPFLHYVAGGCQQAGIDKRSYACAAAGVSVSRNIVHITAEMKRRGLLIGAFWFTMYTTYFAILSLIFFVLENPDSPTGRDILKDAMEGKDTLAGLAKRSMAADRCSQSLAVLFKELPDKLRERQSSTPTTSTPSRKRNPPSSPTAKPVLTQSTLDAKAVPDIEPLGGPMRAHTFPTNPPQNKSKKPSVSQHLHKPSMAGDDSMSYNSPATNGLWNASDSASIVTPESLAAASASITSEPSMQSSPQQLSFGPQLNNAHLPDLTAMMFPSADPFAYPNQPMSILEDGQFKQDQSQMGYSDNSNSFYGNGLASSNLSYDNLAMPMFGSLPPFLMQQGQQPPGTMENGSYQPGASMDAPQGQDPSAMTANQGYWQQIPGRQGKMGMTPAINLDEIFGSEDWSSTEWMNRGFPQ